MEGAAEGDAVDGAAVGGGIACYYYAGAVIGAGVLVYEGFHI